MMGTIPERNCDIVMKGGITSGVVYPLAITELASEFRFKNVGGTSAGAIAAALTAAAEYSRVEGKGAGFERLARLPEFLGGQTAGESNLLSLFPPTRSTRRLFAVLSSLLDPGSTGGKLMNAFGALLVVSPLTTILSFIPAVLLLMLWRQPDAGGLTLPVIGAFTVLALALILLGVVFIVASNSVRALAFTLPRNRFGFSTGRAPKDRTLPGVSEWLHSEIQTTAGRTHTDPPLTFGDLWLAGIAREDTRKQLELCESDPQARSINLQMITTALTHGHPYRLPFENRRFAFRPSELRDYFTGDVVDHMVNHSRPNDDVAAMSDPDLVALPEPWDLPIVVAARMSLSFPILFSLVPLYAVDYTLKVNANGAKQFDRCWFIDGGLSSNFPINLFDSPFPRWPTFGINLDAFHPDHPRQTSEKDNVWIPESAGKGTSDHWLRFPDAGGAAFAGYAGAILDAMRNWRDNTQMAVPGFRDRIVHVKLSPDEGGLNLHMDPSRVAALSERGTWAGRCLRDRFGVAASASTGPNWNTHRWTRYRTSMALLQKLMREVHRAFDYRDPHYPAYRNLVARTANENPRTEYWWRARRVDRHQAQTDALVKFAEEFCATPPDFDDGAPHPRPELRTSPKL